MTRNPLTLCSSGTKRTGDFVALGLLGLAGCLPIDASGDAAERETREPVVGRLQFKDRVVDLTRSAFADTPGAVPRDAVGQVMADIDVRHRSE